MGWRTLPAVLYKMLAVLCLAMPFAAAQDEWFGYAFVFVVFVLPVVIRLPLCVWIYFDAHKRGKSAALWIVVALISPLIGAIIWLLERDKPNAVYAGYYYPPPAYYYPYYTAPPAQPGGHRPTVSCRFCRAQMPLQAPYCPTCGAVQR